MLRRSVGSLKIASALRPTRSCVQYMPRALLGGHSLAHRFHTGPLQLQNSNKQPFADEFKHIGSIKVDKPMMMIAFTCKKCDTRSSHTMSKQAYTKGTVLIQCPGCKNRHLIADHLKIFRDDSVTIEAILAAKGESVSLTTEDLAFEDIPEKLRPLIGHHASDAPAELRRQLDNETLHALPPQDTEKQGSS
ncbi:AaceriADL173Cp [[Ashbya] aceris (nom. inval.)]|nr:AaceriADL173Cp [[Ashbya] aceris (nom. inval.)]